MPPRRPRRKGSGKPQAKRLRSSRRNTRAIKSPESESSVTIDDTQPATTSPTKKLETTPSTSRPRLRTSTTRTEPTPSTSQPRLRTSTARTEPIPSTSQINYEVEKVIDKKYYDGHIWYKLKWVGWDDPTWEIKENCSCDRLIREYERTVAIQSKDESNDEWEVEEIIDKRTSARDEHEYLVRWKNWDGEPTWVSEEDCGQCLNLIAAYENPKLRRMWDYKGSNTKLWLDQASMLKYMRQFANLNGYKVNLLEFQPDFPTDEQPLDCGDGINIGPLLYKNHWYLVIILVNHICITKKLLICDSINTLIGVNLARVHPVYKRMQRVYKKFTIVPVAMTPMDRSDMCAFYVLAAYERALFCLQPHAMFVISKLFFDHSRPELIRVETLPNSSSEISVNLQIKGSFLDGPKCEFCGRLEQSAEEIDTHIRREHFEDPSRMLC